MYHCGYNADGDGKDKIHVILLYRLDAKSGECSTCAYCWQLGKLFYKPASIGATIRTHLFKVRLAN